MAPHPRPIPLVHPLLAVSLVAIGSTCCAALWRSFAGAGVAPGVQLGLVVLAAGIAFVPAADEAVGAALDRARHPSPRNRRRVMAGIWMVATSYLAATAYFHARDLFPRVHDECSYAIGARMLARGRLWLPPHELADFFDTFHLLVRPKYCSIYFPGSALFNVPGVWAGLPSWVVPVVLAGAVVALAYRVSAELIDGVAGLLVAVVVLSTGRFRTFSTMVMSQIPSALLGLLLVWAWLRWRRDRRARWGALAGAFAGWAAVTRPVDALAFTAPVVAAMAWEACRPSSSTRAALGGRRFLAARTAGAMALGAAPFLVLQLIFNLGVTGRPLATPYVLYLAQSQPGSVYGWGHRPEQGLPADSSSGLLQKRIYYEQLLEDEAANHNRGAAAWVGTRLGQTALNTLPSPLLLVALPAAVLGLGRRRWVVCAAVPLFAGLYLLNPFYLDHYAVSLTAAMAFLAVLGADAVASSLAPTRRRRSAAVLVVLGTAAVCLTSLPEFNPRIHDEAYRTPLLDAVEQKLSEVRPPAVVLFRFFPGSSVHEEPVYNDDAAWPDDAAIVRTHDLGTPNEQIFRYYGAKRPARTFYLFDRRDASLTELGPADRASQRLAELDAAKRGR